MSEYNMPIAIGVAVSATLSFLSTSFLVLLYKFSPNSRTGAFRTVIPLFCMDLLWSINILVPILTMIAFDDPNWEIPRTWCLIQGAVKLFTMLSSFFITTTIAWSLYSVLIRKKPIRTKNPTKHFALFTFVIPIIASITPLVTDHYGHVPPLSNSMCFLSVHEGQGSVDYLGIIYRVAFYEVPFLGCLVFDFYSIIRIYLSIKKHGDSHDLSDIANLMLYPMALFLSFSALAVQRLMEILPWTRSNNSLDCVSLSFATLTGFFNAMVYGFISLDLLKHFSKKFSRSKTQQSNVELDLSLQTNDINPNSEAINGYSDIDSSFGQSINQYVHSKQQSN